MTGTRFAISKLLAVITLGISTSAIIGYILHIPNALTWMRSDQPMALPTAIALALLSIAVLLIPAR